MHEGAREEGPVDAMTYAVILNPVARHGWAGHHRRQLERALRVSGLSYELQETRHPGHAVELACQAATWADIVVAAGGDGTVQEVSQGLIRSGHPTPLGIIPMGTGNDFVKMVGMPRRPVAAVQALVHACPYWMDYGRFCWWEDEGKMQEGIFVNAIGMGYDAHVADVVASFKALPGMTAYLAAVLNTLWRWQAPPTRVELGAGDGQKPAVFYEGPLFLATAGNGVCSGGGFYLTPDASARDGWLDLCVIQAMRPTRALQLLPRALRGRHTTADEVHMRRVTEAVLVPETPLPVHVDGEVATRAACRLEVRVVPNGLQVLHPRAPRAERQK